MAYTPQEKTLCFRWKKCPGNVHSPPFSQSTIQQLDRMRMRCITRDGQTVVCDAYRPTAASMQTLHAVPVPFDDLLVPGNAPFNGEHGQTGYIFDNMCLSFEGLFPLYDACMDPSTTGQTIHQLYGLLHPSIKEIVSDNMTRCETTERTKARISNLSVENYSSESEMQLAKLSKELLEATEALNALSLPDKTTDAAGAQAKKRAAASLVRDKTAEYERASGKVNASLRKTKSCIKDALVKYKEMCYRVLNCPDVRFPEETGDVDFCVTYTVNAKPTVVETTA